MKKKKKMVQKKYVLFLKANSNLQGSRQYKNVEKQYKIQVP